MNFFNRWRRQDDAAAEVSPQESTEGELTSVEGERGESAVQRPPSLQARLSNLLAFGLIATIGLGLLGWYYSHMVGARPRTAAVRSVKDNAGAEIALRPLGRVDLPARSAASPLETVLGGPPEEPPVSPALPPGVLTPPRSLYGPSNYGAPAQRDPRLERQLAGPAFSTRAPRTAAGTSPQGAAAAADRPEDSELDALLRPRVTPAVQAQMLPTQRLLLPKGAFLDCTLETAIDSTLPGMTTCVLATDTFSADGMVVLLERGTKLVGETRGQVRQGAARIFVLWTEARTPRGVVVPLASPGTDELGRSGLPGEVDRHFFERFGAAILISVIDGAIQAGVQAQRQSGDTVNLNPSRSQDVMTEVLRSTVNLPPTVVKPQGDRVQVLVARDLDFRSVYELRPVSR
ncbi:MAG: type IV secretion system protein VirB10 [Gammaproteobacteria bacterium]